MRWRLTTLAWLLLLCLGTRSCRVTAQQVSPGITAVPARILAEDDKSGSKSDEEPDYTLQLGIAPLAKLNQRLPQWIQFSGLYRARFEGYSGLNYRPNDDDSYLLSRFRLGMKLRPVSWLKIYSELQDARVFWEKPPVGPPNENTWDLRQAFVEFGNGDDSMFALKVGRQDVNFGAGRLIGGSDWRNAGRAYDAALASLHMGRFRVTAFSLSRVNPVASGLSHHRPGDVTHGLYGGIDKLIPHAVIEPYVFWKLAPGLRTDAGKAARLDEKIVGVRWAGIVTPAFDYAVESAGERGEISTDSVGAYMVSLVGGYTVRWARSKPRFFAEYFFASGDRTPGDGQHGTWDQLNPTHHDRNGLADQVAFQNLKEFRTGLRFFIARNWAVAGAYGDWYLASARDALYDLSLNVVARDQTGRSGTHIGQELDLETSYRISREIEIGAGVGHILPGRFLKNTTPGAAYTYPYFMINYFL